MAREDVALAKAPARRSVPSFTDQLVEPLSRLRTEVDRLFDDFPARWPTFQFRSLAPAMPLPAIDLTETEKTYKLSVEVPGMEAEDIEVSVDGDMLVISGEKKEEREEKEEGYLYSERSFGAFERRFEIPAGAKPDGIRAKVRKGVLQITLPKDSSAAKKQRRIAVETA